MHISRVAIAAPTPVTLHDLMRLPFLYGWIIIAVTFVTMAIGANARISAARWIASGPAW
jgi:hypothetical protein